MTRNTSRFSEILVVLLVPRQEETVASQVGDVVTPPGPCSTSGPLSLGCSQENLPRRSFLWHSGHVSEHLSIRISGLSLRIVRISQLRTLSRNVQIQAVKSESLGYLIRGSKTVQ